MEPVENILNEYRTADAECRLDLFLAHRDMRDRFTAIESDEEAGRASPMSSLPLKSSGASAQKRWYPTTVNVMYRTLSWRSCQSRFPSIPQRGRGKYLPPAP